MHWILSFLHWDWTYLWCGCHITKVTQTSYFMMSTFDFALQRLCNRLFSFWCKCREHVHIWIYGSNIVSSYVSLVRTIVDTFTNLISQCISCISHCLHCVCALWTCKRKCVISIKTLCNVMFASILLMCTLNLHVCHFVKNKSVSLYIIFDDVIIDFGSFHIDIRYYCLCNQIERLRCLDCCLLFFNRYKDYKHWQLFFWN